MVERLHLNYQIEQIIFIWKNEAAKVIYLIDVHPNHLEIKETGTMGGSNVQINATYDICHCLDLTQVYINYLFAARQPTVRLFREGLIQWSYKQRLKKKKKNKKKAIHLLLLSCSYKFSSSMLKEQLKIRMFTGTFARFIKY